MKYTIDKNVDILKYANELTQTTKKYFEIAQKYCLENDKLGCKVNKTTFLFDFYKLEVVIMNNWGKHYYKLIEVK